MLFKINSRSKLIFWQLLFILLSTTWLWAPHLNSILSHRTTLISQYEASSQAFSWLFRVCDSLGALVLLFMAATFIKIPAKKIIGWLLLVIALGLFLDPVFTTTCHVTLQSCEEFYSASFVLHVIETVVTALAILGIAVYDVWQRKKLVSVFFVVFQAVYGLLFISQLADQQHFNTASQYFYQAGLIVYLAWLCVDYLDTGFKPGKKEPGIVKIVVAAWAFLNGILSILISLAHIHLLGKIRDLYFAGDNAWLAQHTVIVGVSMLYLSRHLARGEMRARQIFLVITGIEVIKYSVVSSNSALMAFYLFTFSALFVLRDDFDRGTIPMTWKVRVRDLYFMLAGLLMAALAALLFLDRDSHVSVVAGQSFDHFFEYVANSGFIPHAHVSSALLAHTVSAFLAVSAGSILWILFRPYNVTDGPTSDYKKLEAVLKHYSTSTEDYFKTWPRDKKYFWQKDHAGFIAYKLTGSIAFALADPVAKDKTHLLVEFLAWAKAHRLTVCFLPVEAAVLPMYEAAGFESMQIGSGAVINIEDFLTNTANDKWWRWQKNRAVKNNYSYFRSLPPHSPELIKSFRVVSHTWLSVGGHQERGFALGHFDKTYLNECTIHYLKDAEGTVIAFTNQVPGFATTKTMTVDLLRYLPDVNNSMPYLLYKTIENYDHDQTASYALFDLGFVPFAKVKGTLLTAARALSDRRFSSHGLEQFKNKFNPEWQPYYLVYAGDLADLTVITLNLNKAMDLDTKI